MNPEEGFKSAIYYTKSVLNLANDFKFDNVYELHHGFLFYDAMAALFPYRLEFFPSFTRNTPSMKDFEDWLAEHHNNLSRVIIGRVKGKEQRYVEYSGTILFESESDYNFARLILT